MLPLPRRHAWLAGPPANTCSRNRPQNKRQQRPPKQKIKTPRAAAPEPVKESPSDIGATSKEKTKTNPPRAISPEVARRRMTTPVVAPRSGLNPPRAPAPTPLRHRSNLQRKKQHRHSGIFRVADLGPGTMPRGKYPESPAPAGSHALISRTPTPGGMLHANLGLPRPPPRNFQPPLPRFPSRLSPRRMSETTLGRILSHALQRPAQRILPPPICGVGRWKLKKPSSFRNFHFAIAE